MRSSDNNRALPTLETFNEVPCDAVDKGRVICLVQLHEMAVGPSLVDY
jgi:hypothetical protein